MFALTVMLLAILVLCYVGAVVTTWAGFSILRWVMIKSVRRKYGDEYAEMFRRNFDRISDGSGMGGWGEAFDSGDFLNPSRGSEEDQVDDEEGV